MKHPEYFGCLTGDCPHQQQSECDAAIRFFASGNCPYGAIGDRLWVRETWGGDDLCGYAYRADHPDWPKFQGDGEQPDSRWRPSIHMPRKASRLTLEITGVRVERVQDISEADAEAEGCEASFSGKWWQGYCDDLNGDLMHQQFEGDEPPDWMIEPKLMKPTPHLDFTAKQNFRPLWDDTNGAGSWERNDWCWVLSFRRLEQ